jgi:dTDP-4-amino-4,6-dideoxygalactose transaminase
MTLIENKQIITFIDLAEQLSRNRPSIDEAISRVLNHGIFILGPEVLELELRLARFSEAKHCITCANGTDAISLLLMAKGIGPGDAVFVPSFTFAATAEVVAGRCATPIFVDSCYDTFNMDPVSLDRAINKAKEIGLTPKVVMPVDLFGLPADYDAIETIADQNKLLLFCDSAQGFGAQYKGRKVGSIGHATTTSFFPAKPLGCYGDGGAIFTNDDELASIIGSLRVHGKGTDKYDNIRIGLNSRLDTIQAAILIEKLAIFNQEIESREKVASTYTNMLSSNFKVPKIPEGSRSVWAQYTLRVESDRRQNLADYLKARGVPTSIYYPRPLHKQTAYTSFPRATRNLPISERLASEVISLPMHPYLNRESQSMVTQALNDWTKLIAHEA